MAFFDETSEARTERPTERRRRQARERGQVAYSAELLTASRLLATWIVLAWWFAGFAISASSALRTALEQAGSNTLQPATALMLLRDLAWQVLAFASWPLVTVTSALLLTHFAQVGWLWRWENAAPQSQRLSPILGLQRLLSFGTVGRTLTLIVKLTGLAAAVGFGLLPHLPLASLSLSSDVTGQLAMFGATTVRLAMFVAIAAMILGAVDYAWQRWRFERSLQMTREEVREELKEIEGDSRLKSHRDAQARELGLRQKHSTTEAA